MKRNILIIAPHPDDETLGCGGTILKHRQAGDNIFWLLLTEPGINGEFTESMAAQRGEAVRQVQAAFRFNKVFRPGLPVLQLDTIPFKNIVQTVGGIINEIQANVLYIPFEGDVHSDHSITFKAAWSAGKTFRCPSVEEIYAYETISETEFSVPLASSIFLPNTFQDISNYMNEKLRVAALYKNEMDAHPFPRSLEHLKALAIHRGAACGCDYAEAFMCLKRTLK